MSVLLRRCCVRHQLHRCVRNLWPALAQHYHNPSAVWAPWQPPHSTTTLPQQPHTAVLIHPQNSRTAHLAPPQPFTTTTVMQPNHAAVWGGQHSTTLLPLHPGYTHTQHRHHHTAVWGAQHSTRGVLLRPPPSLILCPSRHLSLAWLDSLAVAQAGWFQGLSQSRFVEAIMEVLQATHDLTHLPWWASIMLTTVLLRGLLTLPLSVYQQHVLARVENLRPEMDALVQELKRETTMAVHKYGWDQKYARTMFNKSARKMWRELLERDNCHPFKASVVLWVQLPLWVTLSLALRNLASMMPHQDAAAQVLFLQLSTGGVAWIPNLTVVDHSLILPVTMAITSLIITEVNALSRLQEGSRLQKISTNAFRLFSIAMIPIAASVPSCVCLYWVTSSLCGLAQNLLLMHPGVRRACGVPPSPSQLPHPYHHLWLNLQRRFSRSTKQDG